MHLRDTHQPTDTPGPLISISNSYKLGEGRVENTRAIVVSLATITKIPWAGSLDSEHLFLRVWRLGSPGWRCWQAWCLVRTLLLVCRCPCALT